MQSRQRDEQENNPTGTDQVSVQSILSGAVEPSIDAEIIEIRQGGAQHVTAGRVEIHQGGAQHIEAESVGMDQSGALTIEAGHVTMNASGAGLIQGDLVELGTNCTTTALIANQVTGERIHAQLLISRKVTGSVETLVDARGAALIGLGIGVGLGLLGAVAALFRSSD